MEKFSKYWSPTVRGNKRVTLQENNHQGAPDVNSGTFLKKFVMVKFSKYWSPTVRGNKRVKFQGNNYQGAPEVNSGTFLKKFVMENFVKFLFFSFFLFPFFLFYLQFQNTKPNPRGQGLRVHSCVLEANPTVAAIFLMTELRNAQLY